MPATSLGSSELLEYDSRYGVLICRECRYAIQKSAIQSHLLRHKIYRGERQRLLSSISRLDLLEPHDVPLPPSSSRPIDALPVINGYRCTVDECENLCASYKRMRRHWGEVHSLSGSGPNISRPAKLQTFFRGTKLRYFEVAPSPTTDTARAAPRVPTGDVEHGAGRGDMEQDEQWAGADAVAVPPSPCIPPLLEVRPKSSLVDFDLETLAYFHHFTTTTSLTLPCTRYLPSSANYWQTDVVLQALQQRWLMCGLLAISACHLATLAEDATLAQRYRKESAQFYAEFSASSKELEGTDVSVIAAGAEQQAKRLGEHVKCIMRCVYWTLDEPTVSQRVTMEPASLSGLECIIAAIRGLAVPYNNSTGSDSGGGQVEMFAYERGIVDTRSQPDTGAPDTVTCGHIPSAILDYLHTLPSRMAEALGKPESAQEVLTTLSAITDLVECGKTSFASDEVGAEWQGMVMWVTRVSDHFHEMVSHHSPAALVVLAHWAALLVRRAEDRGCWFLKGTANTILLQVAQILSSHSYVIQCLVENLMP